MRNDARENAFCLIFESLFHECDEQLSKEMLKPLRPKDQEFCDQIFSQFNQHKAELSEKIEGKLHNFELDRVYKIDLALSYLVLTEVLFCETPRAVAVNEAVNFAKKFSTEKSGKFVNGLVCGVLGE